MERARLTTTTEAPAAQFRVPRLKLKNPSKFDGTPSVTFRSWWTSVRRYFRFYPDIADTQRIAWVGALLTDAAAKWHVKREEEVGDQDTWQAYSEAIQEQYQYTREADTACEKIDALRYKGDIKAFMISFHTLNQRAHISGPSL